MRFERCGVSFKKCLKDDRMKHHIHPGPGWVLDRSGAFPSRDISALSLSDIYARSYPSTSRTRLEREQVDDCGAGAGRRLGIGE